MNHSHGSPLPPHGQHKKHRKGAPPDERWQGGATVARWEPLSEAQAEVQRAYSKSDVLFVSGGAGSGKTITAVGLAVLDALSPGTRRKQVICLRPAVVADEPLGFLKGTLAQKLAPYAEPIRHCLSKIAFNLPQELVRVEALGFARGVTWDDSVIIIDEAQNCSMRQLVLCLTRLGRHSKIVFTGDPGQSDLGLRVCAPEDTALWQMASRLQHVPGVSWQKLPEGECHRHPVLKACLAALAKP